QPHRDLRHRIGAQQLLKGANPGERVRLFDRGAGRVVQPSDAKTRFAIAAVGALRHYDDASADVGFELPRQFDTEQNAPIVWAGPPAPPHAPPPRDTKPRAPPRDRRG